jgi:hypothetical protein
VISSVPELLPEKHFTTRKDREQNEKIKEIEMEEEEKNEQEEEQEEEDIRYGVQQVLNAFPSQS